LSQIVFDFAKDLSDLQILHFAGEPRRISG